MQKPATPGSQPKAAVEIEFDVPAKMRDGTVLMADLYRPTKDGPWPVLVHRTPYGKRVTAIATIDTLAAVAAGYLVVHQDVRGRFASGGDWQPFTYERSDGYDTVEWAAQLPGSSGRVGMFGGSYPGNVQWNAAISQPPSLKTIAPQVTWSDPGDGAFFRGGALELGLNAAWSLGNGAGYLLRTITDAERLSAAVAELLTDFDDLARRTYWELPAVRLPALRRHRVPDIGAELALENPKSAQPACVAGNHVLTALPTFNVGGWYDAFLQGTLDNFAAMRGLGNPAKLVIGPWTHEAIVAPLNANQIGDRNFGIRSSPQLIGGAHSLTDLQLRWFDHWLRNIDTGYLEEPPISIFVMGVNTWRHEDDWPLARARDRRLYLQEGGRLGWEPPAGSESSDTYVYDPQSPVMTRGGALVMASDFRAGAVDQEPTERRADVLVYTSDPLPVDLEVTGRVTATLFAATDAPSTDWVVRLCDVDASGISYNVTDGILRASQEDGRRPLEVDLWSTSIVFKAGHRLRVQVTSSNFPRWDRNPNTGALPREATSLSAARQTVYHERERPSHITLATVST